MDNLYEIMLINKPSLSDSEESKLFDRIAKHIGDKGKIIKKESLGKKQLAYRIKKEQEGNYHLLKLNIQSAEIAAISQKLTLEDNILRFLILKKQTQKHVSDKKITEKKEIKKESKIIKVKTKRSKK